MSSTLISSAELRELLDKRSVPVVVLDTSFDLADVQAGEHAYAQEHLPGAHYLHLDRDLSGPKTGRNGRHPLPERESFARRMGSLGVTPGTQVVVYDRQAGMYAARAWWMLRWLGHAAAAVLDGGLPAWKLAGGSVEATTPTLVSNTRPYPLVGSLVPSVDADFLMQRMGEAPIIDARAPERFRGEVEPLDAQAGHIPGARNRFFKDNLLADGRFKSPSQLRTEFTELLGSTAPGGVVHQCGSGVTACHNLLAMEHAGLAGSSLYPGSWSEWSSDPGRPVEKG